MEESLITQLIQSVYEMHFKNIDFCESLLDAISDMILRDIPIRKDLAKRFVLDVYEKEDKSIIFPLSDKNKDYYLHIIKYQNYHSYIITICIEVGDTGVTYTDISYNDIYDTLKICEDMNHKMEYSLEESEEKIKEFLKVFGMSKKIFISLYEIAEKNGNTYSMFKYITDDNEDVCLLIFDIYDEGLDIYYYDKQTIRFQKYFEKGILCTANLHWLK